MQSLNFASSAVAHAEALADEAADLGQLRLSTRLRERGARVANVLEDAMDARDLVEQRRAQRRKAQLTLSSVYGQTTHELRELLGTIGASALSPGAVLDISERARFRLRGLEALEEGLVAGPVQRLRATLKIYEMSVYRYLEVCGRAQATRDRAILESQVLRQGLERAKARLLSELDPDSDAFRRIKRRVVRTKRASWLTDATVRMTPMTMSEDSPVTSSEASVAA